MAELPWDIPVDIEGEVEVQVQDNRAALVQDAASRRSACGSPGSTRSLRGAFIMQPVVQGSSPTEVALPRLASLANEVHALLVSAKRPD
jgi:hypothetical protein